MGLPGGGVGEHALSLLFIVLAHMPGLEQPSLELCQHVKQKYPG